MVLNVVQPIFKIFSLVHFVDN